MLFSIYKRTLCFPLIGILDDVLTPLARLPGVDRPRGRERVGDLRAEGGRAARSRPGRLQRPRARPRLQHQRGDRVRGPHFGPDDGAIPHGPPAAAQCHL